MVDVRDDGDVAPEGIGDGRGGFLACRHLTSIGPNAASLKFEV
jgi:hypothetical protein